MTLQAGIFWNDSVAKEYHGRRIIMDQNIKNSRKKTLALLMTLCVAGSFLFPFSALAAAPVGYMPGVTEEMTEPSF